MESYVFSRADVAAAVAAEYVPVKIDAIEERELAKRYGVSEWPTDIVVSPYGRRLAGFTGARDASEYMSLLARLSSSYKLLANPDPIAQNGPATSAITVGQEHPYQQAQYAQQYPQQQYAPQTGVDYQGRGPQPFGTPWQPPATPTGGQFGAAPNGPTYGGQGAPYGSSQPAPSQYGQGAYGQGAYGQGAQGPSVQGQSPYGQQPSAAGQFGQNSNGQAGPYPAAQPWPQQQNAQNYNGGASQGGAGQGAAAQGGAWQTGAGPSDNAAVPGHMIDNPFRQPGGAPQVAQRQSDFPPPQGNFGPPPMADSGASGAPPGGTPQPPQNNPPNTPPADHPPIALDGYCPVTVIEGNAWQKGDPRFGAVHRGRTYLFASFDSQQRFLANPDYYSPVFSGYDPVKYLETGELVSGKRNYGVFYDTMYLFADEMSRSRFESDPQRYSGAIRQAMNQFGVPQRR
jgi:YHS domain-containing protein